MEKYESEEHGSDNNRQFCQRITTENETEPAPNRSAGEAVTLAVVFPQMGTLSRTWLFNQTRGCPARENLIERLSDRERSSKLEISKLPYIALTYSIPECP